MELQRRNEGKREVDIGCKRARVNPCGNGNVLYLPGSGQSPGWDIVLQFVQDVVTEGKEDERTAQGEVGPHLKRLDCMDL